MVRSRAFGAEVGQNFAPYLASIVHISPRTALMPARPLYLTFGFAVAYSVITHLAVARQSVVLTALALGLLALVVLIPALTRGHRGAWLAVPVVGLGCWWLAHSQLDVLPLYIPPILIHLFMAWLFGHTLLRGRTPVIVRLVELMHEPQDPTLDPGVWQYARRLTLAWTLLFVGIAAANLAMAACAVPDGLLALAGLTAPVTVTQEAWSWFANLFDYVIIGGFFVIEYAYRRWRFPQQPYRNMFHFISRMFAVSLQLWQPDESRSKRPST
jgi:uncharacterized membrane protein